MKHKDGKMIPSEEYKSNYDEVFQKKEPTASNRRGMASKIAKNYYMDVDYLMKCLNDFEFVAADLDSGGFYRYRRGYLLKCDEIWRKENET